MIDAEAVCVWVRIPAWMTADDESLLAHQTPFQIDFGIRAMRKSGTMTNASNDDRLVRGGPAESNLYPVFYDVAGSVRRCPNRVTETGDEAQLLRVHNVDVLLSSGVREADFTASFRAAFTCYFEMIGEYEFDAFSWPDVRRKFKILEVRRELRFGDFDHWVLAEWPN